LFICHDFLSRSDPFGVKNRKEGTKFPLSDKNDEYYLAIEGHCSWNNNFSLLHNISGGKSDSNILKVAGKVNQRNWGGRKRKQAT
jgi:hypothetical protein